MRHVIRSIAAFVFGLCVVGHANITVFTTNTTIACDDTTFEGDTIVVDSCELTIHCPHTFQRLEAINSANVTHAFDDTVGLRLHILATLFVEEGSSLDVSGRGFSEAMGPGSGEISVGCGGGGAGHGGYGGHGGNVYQCGGKGGCWYGSQVFPNLFGSGGAAGYQSNGGRGGGVIRINVDDSLIVDGTISSNAENGHGEHGGGGAGGSILISARVISGTGAISARGGNSSVGHEQYAGGPGGGGRISLLFCAGELDSIFVNVDPGIVVGEATPAVPGTIYVGNTDCNENSILDGCELANGSATDCNENGILDECENTDGPLLLIHFTCPGQLLLRWSCLDGYASYRIYGSHQNGAETEVATVNDNVYDITSYLDSPENFDLWIFRVVGMQ